MASLSLSTNNKTLNLRYKSVSPELLSSCENVEKLWIGPRLDLPPSLVIDSLPNSLQHLDWDLTDDSSSDGGWNEHVLQELFAKTSLRHLCLRFRGDESAVLLARNLPYALSLESLDLRGNSIGNTGAQALASALKDSCLTSLNLGYNRIGDEGVQALAETLCDAKCKLQYLNLSCNVFGQEGTTNLAESLKNNTSLQELSLFCNHIPYDSCQEFANALQSNVTLEQLKLGGTLTDAFSDVRLQIDHLLKLNRHGRSMLRKESVGDEVWCRQIVAAHGDLDVLVYFLSNKPELLLNTTAAVEQL